MHHSLHHLNDNNTNPQDMNNMGGFKDKMPITHATMLVSTLAISGVPFFSGFLSKDGILAGTLSYYHMHHGWTVILPIAGFGAAMITAFYMFRLIFMTFYGKPNNVKIYDGIKESPLTMTIPLMLLSFLSSAFVFTLNFNPFNSNGWFKELVGHADHNILDMDLIEKGIHHAHDQAMLLSLFVAFFGIVISVLFYYSRKVDLGRVANLFDVIGLYKLSKNKFYIDKIYSTIIYKPFMKVSKIVSIIDWDIYDQKIIDAWGWITLKISNLSASADYNILDQKIIDGVSHIANYSSKKLRKTQSGVLQNYLLAGFAGLVIIIILIQQIR
jgi:NADH-quinone oxidoreductase subunit L